MNIKTNINSKICLLRFRGILLLVVALFAVMCVALLCSCNRNSEGIAATVGETNIMEEDVTAVIEDMREEQGLSSDAQWKTYLSANGVTADSLRSTVINDMVDEEVIKQLAEKYNIEVTQAEVDQELNTMKSYYGEDEFSQSLAQYGMTIEELTDSVKQSLLQDKVSKKLVEEAELDDDILNTFYAEYSSTMNGAKGYYQIMFSSEDATKAADYDAKIKSGAMTFEDACKEVAANDREGYNFDYVSYSNFIQNPEEVNNAMQNMHVGDYSGIVNASGYIYMIKVVDEVNCEDAWSMNNLPEQTQNNIEVYVKNVAASDIYDAELDKVRDEIGVVIYDMPGGLPYSTGILG